MSDIDFSKIDQYTHEELLQIHNQAMADYQGARREMAVESLSTTAKIALAVGAVAALGLLAFVVFKMMNTKDGAKEVTSINHALNGLDKANRVRKVVVQYFDENGNEVRSDRELDAEYRDRLRARVRQGMKMGELAAYVGEYALCALPYLVDGTIPNDLDKFVEYFKARVIADLDYLRDHAGRPIQGNEIPSAKFLVGRQPYALNTRMYYGRRIEGLDKDFPNLVLPEVMSHVDATQPDKLVEFNTKWIDILNSLPGDDFEKYQFMGNVRMIGAHHGPSPIGAGRLKIKFGNDPLRSATSRSVGKKINGMIKGAEETLKTYSEKYPAITEWIGTNIKSAADHLQAVMSIFDAAAIELTCIVRGLNMAAQDATDSQKELLEYLKTKLKDEKNKDVIAVYKQAIGEVQKILYS